MTDSAKLELPFLAPSQAQKHVTVNEALGRLDAAVQISVSGRFETTPPGLPQEGDAFIVGAGGVNAWEGRDGQVASFLNGAWIFLTPRIGWSAWVADESLPVRFDGEMWRENLLALSPGGAAMSAQVEETDFALSGDVDVLDTGFVIPSQSVVFGVTGRVLETITGDLTDWSLGIDGATDRYGSGLGLGAGAWLRGLTGQPVTYYGPTKLRLTANAGVFTGGTVRLAVHCLRFDLPNPSSP